MKYPIPALLLAVGALAAQDPGATFPDPSASGLRFDSTTHVQFRGEDAAVVQFTDSMTIDLHFLAAFDDREGFADDPPTDPGASRCLLSCAEDESTLRYAVYLAGTLDRITFFNGSDSAIFEFPFAKGVWYHLAVVVSGQKTAVLVNGEPIGVEDIGLGTADRRCPLYVGASRRGTENFVGIIRGVRFWHTALALDEVQVLRTQPGVPTDPFLANLLSAYLAVSASGTELVATTVPPGPVRAWRGQIERLRAPFVRAVPWHRNLHEAWSEAARSGKLILVYSTRVDARDRLCDAMENGPLLEDWFKNAAGTVVPYLDLVAGDSELSALGLPAGYCALMTSTGMTLRIFQPWTEDWFAEHVRLSTLFATQWLMTERLEDRIGVIMFELSRRDLPPDWQREFEALREEITGSPASELAKSRLLVAEAHASQRKVLASIQDLQNRYVAAQRDAVRRKRRVVADAPSWGDRVREFQAEALELWATAPLPIEPDPALAVFAMLAWKQAVESGSPELREELLDTIEPIAAMSPMAGLEIRALIPLSAGK